MPAFATNDLQRKQNFAHQPDSEVKMNINIGIMVLRDRGLIAKRGLRRG